MDEFSVHLHGDAQGTVLIQEHNTVEHWMLTGQYPRRPFIPNGATLKKGKTEVGVVQSVQSKGLRWVVTYTPTPKKSTKSKKKKEPKVELSVEPLPVSEDES